MGRAQRGGIVTQRKADTLRAATRWFDITRVGDEIYRITEPHVHPFVRSNAWLVRGRARHLVVDTGLGIGSLPDELGELLDRPVIAVATHAHFDHFGGLSDFGDRAAHVADAEVIEQAADYVTLAAASYPAALLDEFAAAGEPVPDLLVDALPRDGFELPGFRTRPAAVLRRLKDGDVLDLDDRSFQVVHAPGHSPGSICLWDAESGTLFSGDVVVDGEPLLDELPRSNPADFVRSLRRLRELPVRHIHAGHGPSFGQKRMLQITADYLRRREAAG
jgi:glyoxylase-like metal-dependent hydrolase (beta-lactamase superfamily II)